MVPPADPPLDRSRVRLMVVDDDRVLLKVLGRVLADYDLVLVGSAQAALESIAARRPDVLLVDVCMPGQGGVDLWEALAARHPGLAERVLFMTAGVLDRPLLDRLGRSGRPLVRKPLAFDELHALIAATSGQGEGPPRRL